MLPEKLLKFSTSSGTLIPHYLDERDHVWLRLLWEEYIRFVGSSRKDLAEHLAVPLPFASPAGKRKMVILLLNGLFRAQIVAPVSPRDLRARLFTKATEMSVSREAILEAVATEFRLTAMEVERCLFADLPNERCLVEPAKALSPSELALRTNLALIQGLLCRARTVEVQIEGNSGPVIRHAKRKGLICVIRPNPSQQGTVLSISGPYSLFRCTFLYGRALGELLPVLAWCNHFELRAECIVWGRSNQLTVRSGDPVFPSEPPKAFDSKLEERFCRAFQKATKNWDVVREPEPIEAAGTIIFPDFALKHRTDNERTWLVEIIGYWTPEYLRKKMQRLRDANISNLLICISDTLNCANEKLPEGAQIIPFKNKVDPNDLLKVIGDR